MSKIILTMGPSNCGKSTWARKYCEENPNFKELNRDDCRIYLFCDGKRSLYSKYKFGRSNEKLVTSVITTRAAFCVSQGQDLIISDTNLNAKTRAFWKAWAEDNKYDYEEVEFDVPLKVCLERNAARDITLPERVVIQQHMTMCDILEARASDDN